MALDPEREVAVLLVGVNERTVRGVVRLPAATGTDSLPVFTAENRGLRALYERRRVTPG